MGLVRAVVICAVLGLTTGTEWQLETAGETALFNTSRYSPAPPYTNLTWMISDIVIITTIRTGPGNFTNPEYADRITLFKDGSLELRNLTLEDQGNYTVNSTPLEGPETKMLFILHIMERVSGVRVSASVTDLIENQSSVNLTCSASGTRLEFSWYNRTQCLPSKTPVLSLPTVSRHDGPFRCEAYNFVSSAESEKVILNVSYGPDVKDVKAVPLKDIYSEGSKLTLSCIVDSRPEATEITWSFNSDPLPVSGAELVLDPLTIEHRGLYSCEAFNNKTMIYKSSPPLNIAVEKPFVEDDESLSDGAIAGISIACILVALGSVGGLAYAVKRKCLG